MLLQLVPPETVEETRSSTVRAAASIMLLGLGFACLAAILIDLLAQRRTKRNGAGGVEQTPNSLAGIITPSGDKQADGSESEPPVEAAVK